MRKITMQELKQIVAEEFKDEVGPEKLIIKQKPWWKADIENQVDWLKALKIKEFFIKSDKNK